MTPGEPKDRRYHVEPVKALTLRQPWATLLCDPALPKWIETRSRRTLIRGRIGIITGRAWPPSGPLSVGDYRIGLDHGATYGTWWKAPAEPTMRLPLGYLIGTVDLYDCVPIVSCRSEGGRPTPEQMIVYPDMLRIVRRQPARPPFASGGYDVEVCDDQLPYGDFTPGRWAWLTRDAVLFDEPIPMRGTLGWQTVYLPLPEKTDPPVDGGGSDG